MESGCLKPGFYWGYISHSGCSGVSTFSSWQADGTQERLPEVWAHLFPVEASAGWTKTSLSQKRQRNNQWFTSVASVYSAWVQNLAGSQQGASKPGTPVPCWGSRVPSQPCKARYGGRVVRWSVYKSFWEGSTHWVWDGAIRMHSDKPSSVWGSFVSQ